MNFLIAFALIVIIIKALDWASTNAVKGYKE